MSDPASEFIQPVGAKGKDMTDPAYQIRVKDADRAALYALIMERDMYYQAIRTYLADFPTGRMSASNEMQAAITYSSIGPVDFTSTGAAKMRSVGILAGLKAKYPEVPRPLGT